MLYVFKAAFLLFSVAAENADFSTSNNMLDFQYSLNIMFSSFSKNKIIILQKSSLMNKMGYWERNVTT